MAIGDHVERLAMSALNNQVQVFLTWEETGTQQLRGMTLPTYQLHSVRVANLTTEPQTFLVTASEGTEYWFAVSPPGLTHALTNQQRQRTAAGVSISLAA